MGMISSSGWTAQHAAFDAANSSLLSATSQPSSARRQSRIWSAACLGLVSAEAQM